MTSIDIRHGDCLEVLRSLDDNSVDSVTTDPPYGLSNTKPAQVADVLAAWVTGDTEAVPAKKGGFMGADWDSFVPPPAVWQECLRVLKPGGHMAVFAGSRTQDLMGLSIRLAGFEIRDTLGWIYGCLSEDTEVLINGEWVQYHKAKVGDLALCYNKEHDTYEWRAIEDTHKYEYGDTAYRIRSDNTDQIVSRNHRVLVERGGAYEFEYAENLAREHQIRVPVLESLPALLDDLPVPQQVPGGEEPILQRELCNVRPSTGCGEAGGATRNDGDCMCCVRGEGLQAERLVEADENADVLTRVQRQAAGQGMGEAWTQGAPGENPGILRSGGGEDEGREEPRLEGRCHVQAPEGELQGCSVCEVPAGVPEHVAEGWVCDGASSSGGARNREALGENRGCASCESQAGGQSAGEPVSVRVESGSQVVRGARYTVADLAEIEPVRYEGIVWCLTVPTGAFVVRRNGKVFVTGNSGFPKSMDISKAIDRSNGENRKRQREFTEWMRSTGITAREINEATGTSQESGHLLAGPNHSQPHIATADLFDKLRPLLPEVPERIERLVAERTGIEWTDYVKREVVGVKRVNGAEGTAGGFANGIASQRGLATGEREIDITAPATSEAQQWDGWGTSLKPAIEPIILARKPLDGTVAANVLAHGVGGLNIDACRVGSGTGEPKPEYVANGKNQVFGAGMGGGAWANTSGRFPANVLLDEHAAKEMDKQSGVLKSGGGNKGPRASSWFTSNSPNVDDVRNPDSGGASRFFPVFKYQAKAPKKERPVIEREDGSKIQHPTVKPLSLMSWIVALITPPGGTVLDPFAGTGTTLQAARDKGFNAIGVEQDADYIQLIEQRLGGVV